MKPIRCDHGVEIRRQVREGGWPGLALAMACQRSARLNAGLAESALRLF